jgi:hypothetical protein
MSSKWLQTVMSNTSLIGPSACYESVTTLRDGELGFRKHIHEVFLSSSGTTLVIIMLEFNSQLALSTLHNGNYNAR